VACSNDRESWVHLQLMRHDGDDFDGDWIPTTQDRAWVEDGVFKVKKKLYATRKPQCTRVPASVLYYEDVSIVCDCPYMVQRRQERGMAPGLPAYPSRSRPSKHLRKEFRVERLLRITDETDLPRIATTISFLSESRTTNPWISVREFENWDDSARLVVF
jgi:hypothetical protein